MDGFAVIRHLVLATLGDYILKRQNLKEIFLDCNFSVNFEGSLCDLALENGRRLVRTDLRNGTGALSSSVGKAGTNQFENQDAA